MLSLGMDIGTSTVKLVLLRDGAMAKQWMAVHHGRPFACLKKGLSALELDADTPFSLCVTGSNTEDLLEQAPDIPSFGDIPSSFLLTVDDVGLGIHSQRKHCVRTLCRRHGLVL